MSKYLMQLVLLTIEELKRYSSKVEIVCVIESCVNGYLRTEQPSPYE